MVPGGGGISRLVSLVGRGRALEIIAGASDFDGELAERYGYVNRSVTDGELDGLVSSFAERVARFSPRVIRELKQLTADSLPDDARFAPEEGAFFAGLGEPPAQEWIAAAFEQGLQQSGKVEEDLVDFVAG